MDEKRRVAHKIDMWTPKQARRAGWVFVCVGLFMIVGSLIWVINTLLFLPGTVSTNGTVIACLPGYQGTCQAIVRYKTRTGQQITFNASKGSHVGDTVTVVYSPGAPRDARTVDWSFWFVLFTFILGVGPSFIGVGVHEIRSNADAIGQGTLA